MAVTGPADERGRESAEAGNGRAGIGPAQTTHDPAADALPLRDMKGKGGEEWERAAPQGMHKQVPKILSDHRQDDTVTMETGWQLHREVPRKFALIDAQR
jgi:hypothetical protein